MNKIYFQLRFAFLFAVFNFSANLSAATFTVTNTLNTGAGSLRQAIIDANANVGNDNIIFNLGAGGPFTINLTAALPALTDNSGVTIDGWNNSGNNGTQNTIPVFNASAGTPLNPVYKIILGNGANIPTGIIISSSNNIIQGLVMQDFGDGTPSTNDIAVTINGNNNSVLGCYIGMNSLGTTKGTKTTIGIQITGSSNLIGNGTSAAANLISGINGSGYGVYITGAAATGNSIKGNMIGLQQNGSTLVAGATQQLGVYIDNSAIGNIIGGSVAGEGNVISGQTNAGIWINTSVGGGNFVNGNIIGPQADGATFVTSNAQLVGVYLNNSPNNIIGGSTAAERNIISANEQYAMGLAGISCTANVVKGNYVGTDKTGAFVIAGSTQDDGICLLTSTSGNTIGGTAAGEGNLISANNNGTGSARGLYIGTSVAIGNLVVGNIFGTQANGSSYITGNLQGYGIYITASPNNTIGGSSAASRNIVSANETMGVRITGATSTGNIIAGNYIGLDITGTTFIAGSSQDRGVYIDTGAATNTVGGSNAGEGNVISGHSNGVPSAEGIVLISAAAAGNVVVGNIIGPQANGTTLVTGNLQATGIMVQNSPGNTIGGNTAGRRNIISANQSLGVRIYGAASVNNIVKGNYLGLDITGTTKIAGSAQGRGIYVDNAAVSNTIGGTGAGEGNVLSGNTSEGIVFYSTNAPGNVVTGNIIGLQANGTSYVASNTQGYGVNIQGSPNNIIGGSSASSRNIISGNESYGVNISGAGSVSNIVKGNYIGLDQSGTTFLTGSTQDYGVFIQSSATTNTIGGITIGEGNLISGNSFCGIYLNSISAAGNSIQQNTVGAQISGVTWVASNVQSYGIYCTNSSNNIIGGSLGVNSRNIISGNSGTGVAFINSSSTGNWLKGNYIGIGSDGVTRIVSNSQGTGVYLWNGCSSNTIGGINAGEGNVMSGNSFQGENTNSNVGPGNIFLGNIIGPQANGTSYVTGNNQIFGFNLNSAGTIIGNGTAAGRNIISGNTSNGIYMALSNVSLTVIKGNYIGPGATGLAIAGSNQGTGIQIQQDANNNFIGGYLGSGGANPEGNLIAFNTGVGVNVTSTLAVSNLISRNMIYSNGGASKPINLNYGASQGNGGKPAPAIMTFTTSMVTGSNAATAGVGDTVEVFKNTTGNCRDMRTYVGSTLADAAGNWTLTGITINNGETVLATARTVANNNTSEVNGCLVALPIEISAFEAACDDNKKIKLKWSAASQKNNDFFDIQRSADGESFESIGRVKGAGNRDNNSDYSFTDPISVPGTFYYRLKQVDFDKSYSFSKNIFVSDCFNKPSQILIYPNPAGGAITVSCNNENDGLQSVEIIDMLGKVLITKQFMAGEKTNSAAIKIEELSAGFYFLKANTGTKTHLIKFLKN